MDDQLVEEVLNKTMTLDEALELCDNVEEFLETLRARKAMRQALLSVAYFKMMWKSIDEILHCGDQMEIAMRIQNSLNESWHHYVQRLKKIAYTRDVTPLVMSDLKNLTKVLGGTYYFKEGLFCLPNPDTSNYRTAIDVASKSGKKALKKAEEAIDYSNLLKKNGFFVALAGLSDALDNLVAALLA